MRQIINHFTDDDLYKFTMCCAIVENYPRARVRYRFTDRNSTVYPAGFADELSRQIKMLESLVITPDEIDFMRRRCTYIPLWFYNYLKGFRYDSSAVAVSQNDEGHLSVEFEGNWCETVLLEVKVLAIISELYYIMTGESAGLEYDVFYERTRTKGARLLEAGCTFSDFGTRRRASFAAQDTAVRALKEESMRTSGSGSFAGSSNVYMCMKYDSRPWAPWPMR